MTRAGSLLPVQMEAGNPATIERRVIPCRNYSVALRYPGALGRTLPYFVERVFI